MAPSRKLARPSLGRLCMGTQWPRRRRRPPPSPLIILTSPRHKYAGVQLPAQCAWDLVHYIRLVVYLFLGCIFFSLVTTELLRGWQVTAELCECWKVHGLQCRTALRAVQCRAHLWHATQHAPQHAAPHARRHAACSDFRLASRRQHIRSNSNLSRCYHNIS